MAMRHQTKEQEAATGAALTDSSSPPQYGAFEPVSALEPFKLKPPFAPYRPFPPVMHVYYIYEFSVAALKTFKICGPDSRDALFSVEANSGLIPRAPLGTKPGYILHNGPTHKDPVLAAAASESSNPAILLSLNPRSHIMIPPLDPRPDAKAQDLITETMRVTRVDGGEGVAFQFSVVPGPDPGRREAFEWRKVKKPSGYQLVRLSPPGIGDAGPSSGGGEQEHEAVAVLTWPTGLGYLTKAFTLELQGSALCGALGERATLMIVITALRILNMRTAGQTTKSFVSAAEVAHGKEARGQEW